MYNQGLTVNNGGYFHPIRLTSHSSVVDVPSGVTVFPPGGLDTLNTISQMQYCILKNLANGSVECNNISGAGQKFYEYRDIAVSSNFGLYNSSFPYEISSNNHLKLFKKTPLGADMKHADAQWPVQSDDFKYSTNPFSSSYILETLKCGVVSTQSLYGVPHFDLGDEPNAIVAYRQNSSNLGQYALFTRGAIARAYDKLGHVSYIGEYENSMEMAVFTPQTPARSSDSFGMVLFDGSGGLVYESGDSLALKIGSVNLMNSLKTLIATTPSIQLLQFYDLDISIDDIAEASGHPLPSNWYICFDYGGWTSFGSAGVMSIPKFNLGSGSNYSNVSVVPRIGVNRKVQIMLVSFAQAYIHSGTIAGLADRVAYLNTALGYGTNAVYTVKEKSSYVTAQRSENETTYVYMHRLKGYINNADISTDASRNVFNLHLFVLSDGT